MFARSTVDSLEDMSPQPSARWSVTPTCGNVMQWTQWLLSCVLYTQTRCSTCWYGGLDEGIIPLWRWTTSEPFRELSLDRSSLCGTCQRVQWAGCPMEASSIVTPDTSELSSELASDKSTVCGTCQRSVAPKSGVSAACKPC